MRASQLPGLQSLYTVLELSEMSGLTKGRMRRLLVGCGVSFIKIGKTDHVGIAELDEKCGSMWESAKLLRHFRNIERDHQETIRIKLQELEGTS